MGVYIQTYCARVGRFGPGRGYKGHKQGVYNPYTHGTDIHIRMFAVSVMAFFILGPGIWLSNTMLSLAATERYSNYPVDICLEDTFSFNSSITSCCVRDSALTSMTYYVYVSYQTRILLLSMDIETNPGPINPDDKTEILDAIKSYSENLREDIHSVKQDVLKIQDEMKNVWTICNDVKDRVEKIDSKQKQFESQLRDIHKEIEDIRQEKDMIQLDIDAVQENCDQGVRNIKHIEDTIDGIERNYIKSNMRIFGLHELQNENRAILRERVVNEVLRVARPDIQWSPFCITDVYRLGKPGRFARTIIVTFAASDVKFSVFEGREALRQKGIRVANDLTSREKASLSDLREKGQKGYFFKGKLHIREQQEIATSRQFLNARRRTQNNGQENERPHDEPEHAEVD